MSTLPNQAKISSTWKQEVNQRVAAHKNRKGSSPAEPEGLSEAHHSASSRAAAAAARVAARYANAPSYSEIVAGEARAAVRAAEAASRAALEAQAAAESVLAELEAASAAQPAWELHTSQAVAAERQMRQTDSAAEPAHQDAFNARQALEVRNSGTEAFEIRWEPDLPVRQAEPAEGRAMHSTDFFDADMEGWREPARAAQDAPGGEAIEMVEPAQPIHANLIEFPRELVATRRVRPRRAEGPFAASAAPGAQLSIFEVDPGAISIEPTAASVMDEASAPAWTGPEWPGIELGEQPGREFVDESGHESGHGFATEPPLPAAGVLDRAPQLELAPMNLRLMAAMVNGSLILGTFVAAIMVAAANVKDLPPLREIELGSAVALLIVGGLYQALFYALAKGTPGMRYAGISLRTFDGKIPTRAQRMGRLVALLLSLLPVGLGVVWAIFDEDHLSWHDRLSQTYLRRD